MGPVGTLIGLVLTAFIVLMIARMVLDWIAVAGRGPTWLAPVRRVSFATTEPVIAPVRRVLKPVRAGGIGIDLAFTVVFVAALVLRSVAFAL